MLNKSTILVVDDTKENINILLSLLQDYDVLVALNGTKALQIIEKNEIDIILLDIMMPHMDGYEVCSILKSQASTEDIPVLFITAITDEDSIEKAYDVGGIDYVTKPFKPKELLARVKTQLEHQRLLQELEYLASKDTMTGIYNRRKFFELSTKKFQTTNENFYGIMIDIDRFKSINDTYGHPIGDKVIAIVAKTIEDNLCEDAIFGRIGGEEFGIVCTSTNIVPTIEKIRKEVSNVELNIDNNNIISCTISNGIALKNDQIKSLDELLKKADDALYEAKGTGRNKVIFRT